MDTYLVTGANRGIGLELCQQLKAAGHEVIAACRQSSPQLDALGVRVLADCDVSDPAAVQQLAERLGDTSIDVLINNAGVLYRHGLGELDYDALLHQYQVNAVGPLLVTQALLPNLHSGSKVAIITSRMGSVADNTSGGHYGYRMSKAAVNMAGASLAIDLKDRGIAVGLLHPGYVSTDMTGHNGLVDTTHSAQGLLQRIAQLRMENSGQFWHAEGEQLPW